MNWQREKNQRQVGAWLALGLGLGLSTGCVWQSTQAQPVPRAAEQGETIATVDVAQAVTDAQSSGLTYTGDTQPAQQVVVRSRSEGQVLALTADIGDTVGAGQVLARVDRGLLSNDVAQAEAELGARQGEVEQARFQLAEAQTEVARAQAEYQQAQADADRFQRLADQGAVTSQEAEVAQTNLRTAEQAVRSAQEQVNTRARGIVTVERRVAAQRAIVAQAQERLSYSTVVAPFRGIVLSRMIDPGDVVQVGQELMVVGDFSQVRVEIQMVDRDRGQISLGQPVTITLDAFPGRTFPGRITRISPVADTTTRLIPVQVTLSDADGQVGSGLLARVNLASPRRETVVVPQAALELGEGEDNVLFVLSEQGEDTLVEARPVQAVPRGDGQVEILAGLAPGETYVIRSDRPLQGGQTVRRSFLSDS
jgi:HlyD family secretion protein